MEPETTSQPGASERTCGGCTACCTALRVSAIEKPAGTPCMHAGAEGCSIYDDRPAACRAWSCLWLRATPQVLGDRHRPDRLGILLNVPATPPEPDTPYLEAIELRPGAADEPECRGVIDGLRAVAVVRVVRFGKAAPAARKPRLQEVTLSAS